MKADQIILAADIGGSHITAGLIDVKSRALVSGSLQRRMVNASGNAADILDSWSQLLCEAATMHYSGIALAVPGPFDYQNGISFMKDQGKYGSLYNLDVRELLAQRLKVDQDKITFFNDAASFLAGEIFAAGKTGSRVLLGVTLGTGLGTAISVNSEVKSADLWSSSFKKDIAEFYLSSKWFVQQYFQNTGHRVEGVKQLAALSYVSREAANIFQVFSYNLADFLIEFIKAQKAEAVYVGGNIALARDLFWPVVKRIVSEALPLVSLEISALGEVACLYGAAKQCAEK